MATDLTTIYRFPNATLIKWAGNFGRDSVSLFEDGVVVSELTDFLSEDVTKSLGRYSYRIHWATAGELELTQITWTQEVVSYLPLDESNELRELNEADYEKLSAGFQKLYKKKLSEPTEVRENVEYELREVPFELQENFLTGKEHATKLHAVIQPLRERERKSNSYGWGRDERPADLRNNLPLDLSSEELLKVIDFVGQTIIRGSGYGATVELSSGYREPSVLKISFFGALYNGELKKILSTKQGGGHYADGRGRMVRDFPRTVGTAVITHQDVTSWWALIGGAKLSDAAKFEALEELAHHLWRVE